MVWRCLQAVARQATFREVLPPPAIAQLLLAPLPLTIFQASALSATTSQALLFFVDVSLSAIAQEARFLLSTSQPSVALPAIFQAFS